MTLIDVAEIGRFIRATRRDEKKSREAAYNELLDFLTQKIGSADSEADRSFLYHRIADQHSFYRHVDEEEETWRDVMRLFPNDPLSWTSASGFYLYTKLDPVRAVDLAMVGMKVAEDCGCFVVEAGNTLCRAARKAENYDLMEETIKRILNYKRNPKSSDSSYECDFLVGLPDGVVSEILVRKLTSMCKS
jgi:hypothetical protein